METGVSSKKPENTTRISKYIASFDGTRIAVDIYIPVADINIEKNNVPVVLICRKGARRRWHDDNSVEKMLALTQCGYAVAVMELRGCGVSFGYDDSFGSKEHCEDIAAVIAWLKQQPWSNGKVGMQGGSNRGYYQLCTISRFPGLIDALTVSCAVPDFYFNNYPNGVSALPPVCMGKEEKKLLTKDEFYTINDPVDDDYDGAIGYQAYKEDQYPHNHDFFKWLLLKNMNRDSENPHFAGMKTNLDLPPKMRLYDLKSKTHIVQNQLIGQLEPGTLDQLNQFLDYGGHVTIGPWDHMGTLFGTSDFEDGTIDYMRLVKPWFDWSLKGIDNGYDQIPPVKYYVFNAPKGKHWRISDTWPPENEIRTILYLHDKELTLQKPNEEKAIEYKARMDTIPFMEDGRSKYSRMHQTWDGDMNPDVDQRGLCYTSKPLWNLYQNEFAGCISVNLWIDCSQNDVDLFVYAEEVLADGTSHYIRDGMMRASHRISGENSGWEKMSACWHTSLTQDVDKCLNEGLAEPVNLNFAIDPVCYHIRKGSRLRFTVTCANAAACQHNYDEKNLPVIHVYEGGDKASYISIPFLENVPDTFEGEIEKKGVKETAVLYLFERNIYLYHSDIWEKFEREYYDCMVNHGELILDDERVFTMKGIPKSGMIVDDEINQKCDWHPLPWRHGMKVAKVPVNSSDSYLFVPGHKNLKIDLYKDDVNSGLPCIVYMHGYNSPYNKLPKVLRIFFQKGYAIACINMRDYPPNIFPEPIYDMKGCIRWLRANADQLGIDPARIGFYGTSFGGNASLMAAVTCDNSDFEGTIGGNLNQSSAVQAAAAGFAWSDLLNMGPDIAAETFHDPVLSKKRMEMTDGEESPSAAAIGYTGKEKGIAVLRDRLDQLEESRQAAKLLAEQVSPVNLIRPGTPPLLLFGGYGDPGVNIACRQSYRTFEKLAEFGCLAHLSCNTQGHYTDNEETVSCCISFFERYLKKKDSDTIVIKGNSKYSYIGYSPVENGENIKCSEQIFLISSEYLKYLLNETTLYDGWIDLYQWNDKRFNIQVYSEYQIVIIDKKEKGKIL